MSAVYQKIDVVRVDLCDREAQRIVGSVRPRGMVAKRDLAGNIRLVIPEKVIVPHERTGGAGTIMFFYARGGRPILSISAPRVTVTGESIELTETPP
jgi:hypothetical protein